MTQEEKLLLLRDICERLPYGVICEVEFKDSEGWKQMNMILRGVFVNECYFTTESGSIYSREFKPYLRPMSSMTEKEKKEYKSFFQIGEYACGGSLYGKEYEYMGADSDDISQPISLIDWLNKHHFDYRDLIPMGLALEALDGMYNTKIE